MNTSVDDREIPLTAAALRLRQSYQAMRDRVLTGAIAGRQTANGRWLVDAVDVERAVREGAADRQSKQQPIA